MSIASHGKPLAGNYTSLGYRAAQIARTGGRAVAPAGSGDYHLRYDRDILVRQSQEFMRDNGLYEGVVNRAVDNIIGAGFTHQARTDDAALNSKIETLWREEFANDPEVRGMDSWYECERLALCQIFVDGDVAALKTTSGQIQMLDSERITSIRRNYFDRRVEDGVELNAVGKPIAFWIADYDKFGYIQKAGAIRYSADDCLFMANRKRISQTRGVPVMTSNFPMFHRINDICDSEAIAWQMLARMALSVNRKDAEVKATLRSGPGANAGASTVPPLAQDRIQEFDYGMIFHAEPGEEIKGIERNLPGSDFPQSITMFIRLLGLPVGFPLELILLDWSKTNYSSARAALEQAFRMFNTWQQRLKARWHTPIYRWKLQQWIDEKRIPDKSDIFKHEWIAPSFPWIDQLKEALAWGERIDRGLATLQQACKSLNQDREEWLTQRKREINEAITAADEINKKNPDAKVPWQIFAGIMAPKQSETKTQALEPEIVPVPEGEKNAA